jgi:hypothetical protein
MAAIDLLIMGASLRNTSVSWQVAQDAAHLKLQVETPD